MNGAVERGRKPPLLLGGKSEQFIHLKDMLLDFKASLILRKSRMLSKGNFF